MNESENLETSSLPARIIQRNRTAPSQLVIPRSQQLFARPFTPKFKLGLFLGSPSSQRRSLELEQYRRVRLTALSIFNQGTTALEPSETALQRTKQAAKSFFSISHQLLAQNKQVFPLAGYNKCLGMVAIPNSKLVMIAISQDKRPEADTKIRKQMIDFLDQINQYSQDWQFELACIPTPSQYLMPRTLRNDIHYPAPKEHVEPHTRCVEIALMVALNKIKRFKGFSPSEMGVMALSGTLWGSLNESNAIDCFSGVERNKKYVVQKPIEVNLYNGASAWVDIWEPCDCHCKIYKYEMAAIAAAGSTATSFSEPRSDCTFRK